MIAGCRLTACPEADLSERHLHTCWCPPFVRRRACVWWECVLCVDSISPILERRGAPAPRFSTYTHVVKGLSWNHMLCAVDQCVESAQCILDAQGMRSNTGVPLVPTHMWCRRPTDSMWCAVNPWTCVESISACMRGGIAKQCAEAAYPMHAEVFESTLHRCTLARVCESVRTESSTTAAGKAITWHVAHLLCG